MYIAMNRFKVMKGAESAFEHVWLSRDTHLDRVPGFLEFHLLRGPERDDFDAAVRQRLESWLTNLRAQLEPGELNIAPLRTMVAAALTSNPIAVDDPAREHITRLMLTLDAQLRMITVH